MQIGIPAETRAGEARVAATPETVKKLVAGGHHKVVVQSGAGMGANIPDAEFVAGNYYLIAVIGTPDAPRFVVQQVDPERLFEQRWAVTLLENVLKELEIEHTRNGRADVFATLSGFLSWRAEAPSYAEAATKLGVNEQAARVAVHRLRRRYRDLLQKHIAVTVEDPAEVDAELDHLLTVFSAPT